MTNQTTAVATTQERYPTHQLAPAQTFDLSPRNLEEAMRMCDLLSKSDLVPKDFQGKPGNMLVAIQWGAEIGLKPLQAMQNIAVINGRPSLWGDSVLALVLASPVCEYVQEWEEGDTAFCRVKRRNGFEKVTSFSAADAKTAGLSGKSGPWTQYPRRMRQLRARGFALRDQFADVLKGMPITEELADYSPEPPQELPRNAPPAQVAAAALPKVERTERHDQLIEQLELRATTDGFEAFKADWAALPKDDRAAIGLTERDRIAAIGMETDKLIAEQKAEEVAEGGANG